MSLSFFPGSHAKAVLTALGGTQAMIEFDPSGKILSANDNFCRALGYSAAEIIGKHHSIFCDPKYSGSQDYRKFWQDLANGKADARQYKRIGKGGTEVWIQASYNPVIIGGKVQSVIKIATVITEAKLKSAEDAGKINAISRAQAIIEFTTTGQIITANSNFLNCLGYRLEEIKGKHHSMFCEAAFRDSADYATFWKKLAAGEFIAQEFKRIGKGGKPVWIQASYNPILDEEGNVFKIVKFATDVTERVRAVNEIADGLTGLANGDLTTQLNTPFIPALDKLRTDFNGSIARLRDAMKVVSDNATGIAGASHEVSIASSSLAERTEKQAAAVEQTAAALEEMTQTVTDNSRRAEEAGQLVAKAKSGAELSGTVVNNAIAAMDEIEQSSKGISNIIGVIDEIAFQTNLLALNAGVEAARAGEAGKGFAVVAQEVRELAQRSANAAKEIKALITKSTEQVANGVSLVDETGKSLELIVRQVAEINQNVAAMIETTREQATGLKEINSAVNSIDANTQQNAAVVEETSAASHGLAKEAESLRNLLRQFRFTQDSHVTRNDVKGDVQPLASRARGTVATPAARTHGSLALAQVQQDWEEF
ncbi:PAS domain S-box protein [Rhizobium sp. CG4]|uniref:methyl-accepting chemotaxis protein n=1 Tax=Rhizobium sp. CG4 TaxID=2726075 RepID=UPI0020337704|nr:PAS domain-containing methyl-accepting chemotaxis protein [Rhizobium sp. CG4]MCM2457058.1 PAS domain S-box protein [Rhizobium sp. CG4]